MGKHTIYNQYLYLDGGSNDQDTMLLVDSKNNGNNSKGVLVTRALNSTLSHTLVIGSHAENYNTLTLGDHVPGNHIIATAGTPVTDKGNLLIAQRNPGADNFIGFYAGSSMLNDDSMAMKIQSVDKNIVIGGNIAGDGRLTIIGSTFDNTASAIKVYNSLLLEIFEIKNNGDVVVPNLASTAGTRYVYVDGNGILVEGAVVGGTTIDKFSDLVTSTPTDSSFLDGYFPWTVDTKLVDAFDDINELLLTVTTGSVQIISPDDKFLVSEDVVTDNTLATLSTITNTPADGCYVAVFYNGQEMEVGNGVTTKAFYFSGDGGTTARGFSSLHPNGQVQAGDGLYFNPSVAGYTLSFGSRISFMYMVTI